MAEPDYSEFTPVEEPIASVQPQEQDWSEFTPVDEVAPDLSQMGVHQGSTVAFDKTWLPAVGSVDAFKQGYNDINRASQMVLGDNIVGNNVGKIPGVIGGAAMSVGTLLNPIGKAIAGVPKVVQAGAEALSGEKGNAYRTISGQREVLPNVQPHAYNTGSQILDTALNTGSELVTQVRKDPTLLASASPKGVAKVVNKLNPTLSKPPKAIASPLIAESVEFTKPVKGQTSGHIADVFDAKDLQHIDAALAPKNKGRGQARVKDSITRGAAEAIRNDPQNTTSLQGLRESSENAIEKVMAEVNMLKEKIAPQDMSDVASQLESAIHKGMSADDQAIIKQQAAKYRGQTFDINDIHNTTKYLGDKLIPLWANDDAKAVFARKVMATERAILNDKLTKSLESVGGERAGKLRSTVSDLIQLNDHIDAQAAKLARTIKPEYRGSLANLEGRIALISAIGDIFTGNTGSAIAKGGVAVERLLKGSAKADWTNPNLQIEKLNKSLRKKVKFQNDPNPPVEPAYSPMPPLPPLLSSE